MASEFMKTFDGMTISYEENQIARAMDEGASGQTYDIYFRKFYRHANAITSVLRQHGYNPSREDILRAAFAGLPVGDPMLDQLA